MRKLLILLLLSMPVYATEPVDIEECMALGQIAGDVVIHTNQGYTKDNIWSVYQGRFDPVMKPVVEELARLANHPELRKLNAGDFIEIIVVGCLEDRKNSQQDQ